MENKRRRISEDPWEVPFKTIQEITNNFSEERKIGSGAFGQVYKGVREDGEEIAVKRLHFMPGINSQHFQNEVQNLKGLDHKNIVRLLGSCEEYEEMVVLHGGKLVRCEQIHWALCLEYVPNGSLANFLSGECLGKNWPLCYRIIKGICEGLKYLHEVLIWHLDLKPDNILLDKDMVPKIADFGISRLIGEENTIRTMNRIGTRGYYPPEFINSGIISEKYDIFSLGVIIAKIITGAGYSNIADMEGQEFIEQAYDNWRKSLQEIPNCASVEEYCNQVRRCIEIAVNCMDHDRRKRPRIKDIVSKLDEMENVSSLEQPQHLGTVPDLSNIQRMDIQQQNKIVNPPHHAHEPKTSQFQSPRIDVPQLLMMLQNPLMLQEMLACARMILDRNNNDLQMQYLPVQSGPKEVSSSTSSYISAQTSLPDEHDWQEELYEMIKSLKDEYFVELNDLYMKISSKLQHVENHMPLEMLRDQYEKMKGFKMLLERTLQFLQINKDNIQPSSRGKIPIYKRQIIAILNSQRLRKPAPPIQEQQKFQQSAREAPSS